MDTQSSLLSDRLDAVERALGRDDLQPAHYDDLAQRAHAVYLQPRVEPSTPDYVARLSRAAGLRDHALALKHDYFGGA